MKSKKLSQPPAFLVAAVTKLTDALLKLRSKMLPAQALLMEHSLGAFLTNHSLALVAKLEIADRLKTEAKSVQQLAQETQTDAEALYRILRAVASFGVFRELPDRVFCTNKLGRALEKNAEDNLHSLINFVGADWHHEQWGSLLDSVKNGKDIYQNKYGKRFYEWYDEHPEAARVFNDGMISLSAISDKAIAAGYPFGQYQSVLDVAGGIGGQLATILAAYPGLSGALFEQPQVIDDVPKYDFFEGISARVELIKGNFFADEIPTGYDVYLMKSIVHNWEDQRAAQLLGRVRKAMQPESKLLLAELVVGEANQADFGKLLDVAMLATTGGIERTGDEYAQLLAGCGLRLSRIVPTASPYSLVEAVVA